MATGIPYLTLGTDGTPIAQYGDGTVVPLSSVQLGGSSGQEVAPGSDPGIQEAIPPGGNGDQGGPGALGDLGGIAPLLSIGGLASLGQPTGDAGGGYLSPIPHPSGYPAIPGLPAHGGGYTGLFGMESTGSGNGHDRSLAPAGNSVQPDYGGGGPGASGQSGGGGGIPDVGARLADARSRLASAKYKIQSALGGSSSSGYSSSSASYNSGTSTPTVRPTSIHTHFGRMDEAQAAGLTARPTTLLPRVFGHGFNPSNPAYTTLSGIPAGQMALLLGKGTPRSTVNKIGGIYQDAGTTGDLPSTGQLMRGFTRGRGLEDMIQGVKAGPGDTASYSAPGYVYGKEPMSVGEASGVVGGLVDAALYNEPLDVQAKYSGTLPGGWGSYLIDKWGSKAIKRPAGKGAPIYRYVGRRLFR